MLKELRSQELTPRNYYELYMKVLEELRYLEEFFMGLTRSGTMASELYEQVQSCGMVLPRLYLLITVGSVYIKSRQAPAKDILKDLVEMTKGVQHPMRGLFLRNYLAHVARDKLPDTGSEYSEGGGGTEHDSLDFVIQVEMRTLPHTRSFSDRKHSN
jgi:vacuolar protein sorting-associated protein 35